MLLYFQAKISELRLTYHEFFETAYQWRFGRLVMLDDDYAQFLLHSVLPKYVVEFLQHLQESEGGNHQMLVVQSNGSNQQQRGEVPPNAVGETYDHP